MSKPPQQMTFDKYSNLQISAWFEALEISFLKAKKEIKKEFF